MRPVSPQWAWVVEVVVLALSIVFAVWLLSGPWWGRHPRLRWWAQGFAVFMLGTAPLIALLGDTSWGRSPVFKSNAAAIAELVAMVAMTVAGIHLCRWAWRRGVVPGWGWLTRAGTVRRAVVLGTLGAVMALVALRVWVLAAGLAVIALVMVLALAATEELTTLTPKWWSNGDEREEEREQVTERKREGG